VAWPIGEHCAVDQPYYCAVQANTKRDAKYSLKASYAEIYNEGVYDLVHFSPKAKSLPVKWDASYGFYVQGLKVGVHSHHSYGPCIPIRCRGRGCESPATNV